MRDRNGLSIQDHDRVVVQTAPDGPVSRATVIDTTGHTARRLNCVLVQFENGTRQFMGGEHLAIVVCEGLKGGE